MCRYIDWSLSRTRGLTARDYRMGFVDGFLSRMTVAVTDDASNLALAVKDAMQFAEDTLTFFGIDKSKKRRKGCGLKRASGGASYQRGKINGAEYKDGKRLKALTC